MDVVQAIMSRRSICDFINKDISLFIIDELLQASMQAPSAYNQQP